MQVWNLNQSDLKFRTKMTIRIEKKKERLTEKKIKRERRKRHTHI